MKELLQQLQTLVESGGDLGATPAKGDMQLESVQHKLVELRDIMDHNNDATTQSIEALRSCSSNPGANYYWLIFVVMYGSIYFMQ
jgi:hypothetical protein